ncbi:dihydrofolate reductase [Bacillus anthracis]|uniref:dihydrofolate reductase n=1 Tax=Bacillus anthracis TaxID=1392 RepID=UPI000D3CDDF5|nr:dihydrofolate reductase [Bacillus anthracis]PTR88702.1 hypothetical protein DBA57_30520 [Bacillus anthracis]
MIKMILACDLNGVIGNNGSLPWGRSLPYDLKRFKDLTEGHVVVMGRKTFESLGSKPLPNRENVVLSSQSLVDDHKSKFYYAKDIDGILEHYDNCYGHDKDLWIIGGLNVYEQFFPYAQEIYLTVVDAKLKGDTKLSSDFKYKLFHDFSYTTEDVKEKDEDNMYRMHFEKHVRIKGEYN